MDSPTAFSAAKWITALSPLRDAGAKFPFRPNSFWRMHQFVGCGLISRGTQPIPKEARRTQNSHQPEDFTHFENLKGRGH